jgi:hypothetical protein
MMKQIFTFAFAVILSNQAIGHNISHISEDNPLKARALFIENADDCISVLVIVEKWNGMYYQFLGQGKAFVSTHDKYCNYSTGMIREASDPIIYEGYLHDKAIKTEIDGAIDYLVKIMDPNKAELIVALPSNDVNIHINAIHHLATVNIDGATHERTMVHFEIFDEAGKRVFYDDRYNTESGEIYFTTKMLKAGTYIFEANICGKLFSKKFMVH